MLLDIKDLPFRPESPGNGTKWFDRDGHIQMYAAMLDTLKLHVGDDWYRLSGESGSVHLGPETKRTISTLIRKSGESCDYETTVDFVTTGALRAIGKRVSSRSGQTVTKGDLAAHSSVAHEHMCPTNEVLRCLTSRNFEHLTTAEILRLSSFRALVSGPRSSAAARPENPSGWTDVDRLDVAFRDTVPDTRVMAELVGRPIPLKYYPLLRYHQVGLLGDLIAVTGRADTLLREYKAFVGRPALEDREETATGG